MSVHVGKGLPTYCVTRAVGRQPFAASVSVHPPCLYPGSEAILAAISADETSALPGGSERLRLNQIEIQTLMSLFFKSKNMG